MNGSPGASLTAKLPGMRAEAASWNDLAVNNAPPSNDDDKWHVQIDADEVKIVSLDQLDDLFRLSLVDAETKVWQPGMAEWQPLRVIADLDEQPPPELKRSHPKPPSPRPAPVRSAPPPPQPPPSARPQSAPPRARSAPPPPRSAPPPPNRAPTPASFYPESISLAPAPLALVSPVAAFAAPQPSFVPSVVSYAPPRQQTSSGLGRLVVGLALVAGVGVTLYRNDLVQHAAHAMNQDALYARLEAALGGPAFGTVRALSQSPPIPAAPGAERHNIPAPLGDTTQAASPPAAAAAVIGNASSPPVVSLESLAQERKVSVSNPRPATAAVPAPAAAEPKSLPSPRPTAVAKPEPVNQ